ncbi:MAG: sialidase family protein [Pseudomonadota bacterium]
MASTPAGRHLAAPLGLVLLPLATTSFAQTPGGFERGPALELREHFEHLGVTAREPMLVSGPEGVLYVSGYPSRVTGQDWTVPPLLWRSDDGGRRWAAVSVGEPGDGAQGNSDVDLALAADGALYFATMGFNRETREGTHVTLGSSTDSGKSWRWHMLARTTLSDRPWIAADDEGSAYAIWNDGAGVLFTRSTDRGANWTTPGRIADSGGSSHLTVGPGGRIAVRVSPTSASGNRFDASADFILVSADRGSTWARVDPPAKLRWDPNPENPEGIPRWVSPLAFTPDGHLHHVWSEGDAVHHAASADLGNTWARSKLADADGTAFFPFLTADAEGRLAATWFVNRDSTLTVQLALLTPSKGSSKPSVSLAEPFIPDSWDERLDTRRASPAGEYAAVAFLENGDIGVVTPVQDLHNARGGFSLRRFAIKP